MATLLNGTERQFMKVRSFEYGRYHGKGIVGSTRLRVKQLQKYWPDYTEYKYGEKPDVMVYQKVYIQADWRFMEHFEGIQILDICDPDWLEYQNVKETIDCMDGVVVPTESMAEFIRQLTDKPVKVITDRHDLEKLPKFKSHSGKAKNVVWFGYAHNAELLQFVIPVLERKGYSLTVIANENPYVNRWAANKETFQYYFKHFDETTLIEDLREFDICVFPQGNRPKDRFKSNNKTTLAWLAGLPVVTTIEELEEMEDPITRNEQAKLWYNKAINEYDVKLSVQEMKAFIDELSQIRNS